MRMRLRVNTILGGGSGRVHPTVMVICGVLWLESILHAKNEGEDIRVLVRHAACGKREHRLPDKLLDSTWHTRRDLKRHPRQPQPEVSTKEVTLES